MLLKWFRWLHEDSPMIVIAAGGAPCTLPASFAAMSRESGLAVKTAMQNPLQQFESARYLACLNN